MIWHTTRKMYRGRTRVRRCATGRVHHCHCVVTNVQNRTMITWWRVRWAREPQRKRAARPSEQSKTSLAAPSMLCIYCTVVSYLSYPCRVAKGLKDDFEKKGFGPSILGPAPLRRTSICNHSSGRIDIINT